MFSRGVGKGGGGLKPSRLDNNIRFWLIFFFTAYDVHCSCLVNSIFNHDSNG